MVQKSNLKALAGICEFQLLFLKVLMKQKSFS